MSVSVITYSVRLLHVIGVIKSVVGMVCSIVGEGDVSNILSVQIWFSCD